LSHERGRRGAADAGAALRTADAEAWPVDLVERPADKKIIEKKKDI
jgi:hypothetical protein